MKKLNLLVLLSFVLSISWTACNSDANNDKTDDAPEIDSLTQDSINKTNFMAQYNRYFNDVARFMAGLPQTEGSSIAKIDTFPESIEYRKSNADFFKDLYAKQISKIEAFSNTELKDIRKEGMTLFYPFSGPDFINSDPFFPEATTTIMFGLEPVGNVPYLSDKITGEELKKVYKTFRRSIDSIYHLNYFMTNEMSRDLNTVAQLDGNLSIISLFMAQRGYRILDVKKVTINSEGAIVDSIPGWVDIDDPTDTYISGGLIEYMKPDEYKVRKLYYFSHDVSDEKIAKTPEMLKFFKSLDIDVAFFKAASYLCSWLHTIREFTLENAKNIVQDDSGIYLKYFEDEKWDKTFYGKYSRTRKVFKSNFQNDLKAIYDKDTTIKPLDFKFGYGSMIKQDNIMVARKK
ncbi:MAG: hypothetical protein P1P88_17855 [Bacteroidales bacterium]|nr:hypothetical protein [Bacteroidales bacterium]